MTFGQYIADELLAEKLKRGAKLRPEHLVEVGDRCYRAWQQKHRRPVYLVSEDGPRDPLFDALASAEGSNPKELTRTAARRIAVALASIRRATPAVTPEEITKRAVRYRELFPRTVVTANAMEANWPKLNCFKFTAPAKVFRAPEPPPADPNAGNEFAKIAREHGFKLDG